MAAVSVPQTGPSGDSSARLKSERAKLTEAVKEMHQIKLKVEALEREKSVQLFGAHSQFGKQHGDLQDLDRKTQAECKMERTRVIRQISKIKSMVAGFRRELTNVRPTPEFVEKLKGIMEDIESHISNFKEQQKNKYEDLLREEHITVQELAALERRMETWSQMTAAPVNKAIAKTTVPLASHRDITKDLPPEVASFERFVQQHGGPRGGWDEYDHGMFLKYRLRYKGKPVFLEELRQFVPTKTPEEISHHEVWYKQYLDLQEKKKVAIQMWKARKENEKAALKDSDSENSDEEEEKLKAEQREKQMEQERHQRRAQLNAWKVEKELQKAAAEEKRIRQELEKAKKIEDEKKRQAAMREEVERFRQQKQEEEQQQKEAVAMATKIEQEARRKQGRVVLARFQERDHSKLHEKISHQKEKEKYEKEEKERRLQQLRNQVEVNVARDPSRLLQPTKGWMERQKEVGPSGGGQMYHLPHRAVPTWRQGMI